MSNNNLQLQSRCNPHGINRDTGLIGQIYFATDRDNLDTSDESAMNMLRPFSMFFLGGQRIHMWCKGYADHRFTDTHNRDLGQRRANAVQQYLNRMFRNAYFTSSAISLGEDLAYAPQPSETDMASDRRVDIFVNRIRDRPPIRLPNQHIFGRLPPEIQIEEVYSISSPPQSLVSPATRTSRPVAQRNPLSGGQTRNSPLEQLPKLLRLANQASIESRIEEDLDRLRSIISFRMINHSRGGILVVAVVDVVTIGGQTAGNVLAVFDLSPEVYANTQDAIGSWRSQPSLFSSSSRPPFGHIEFRYFWATRSRN